MIRRNLLKLKYGRQGDVMKRLDIIRSLYNSTPEINRQFQRESLKDVLTHAYENVAYYNRVFKEYELFSKQGNLNLDNFKYVPPLTKDIIRNNYEDLISKQVKKMSTYVNHSGGATGAPVKVLQSQEFSDWSIAMTIFFDEFCNYKLGDRKIKFWGSQSDLFVNQESAKLKLGRALKNELWLNAFIVNKDKYLSYLEKWNAFKPKLVIAYVDAIYELAKFIEDNNLVGKIYSPPFIMTSAGTLHEFMREKIETVFNTIVINRYGCREVSNIACELPNSKQMLVAPMVKVDSDYSLPNGKGNLLITSLSNKAMPLIKYEIGDIGVLSDELNSKNGWGILETVEGRSGDITYKGDGSIISSTFLTHFLAEALYEDESFKKFQLVQNPDKSLNLKLIPSNLKETSNKEQKIVKKLQLVFGDEISIMTEIVNEIPLTQNGKHRFIISNVPKQ